MMNDELIGLLSIMKKHLLISCIFCISLWMPAKVDAVDAGPDNGQLPERPNIIIIFTDDQGYGDLGVYGHPTMQTPNLDRMASEGLKLTSFYVASSVCTPSRAALLTGRLPIRSGMSGGGKNRVLYPDSEGGLPQEEFTLAEALKEQGYATACVGKWHLGSKPEFLPTNQGFDHYFGLPYSNDMNIEANHPRHLSGIDPNADFEWWDVPLMRDEKVIERPANQHLLTKRYTRESVKFIRETRKGPFFLYMAHSMPHVPLFVSEEFSGRSKRGRYGDTIEEIDWSVGQILETVRDLGIERKTLVFFTSDNGPWLKKLTAGGSAGLLRDGKGGTWEGGLRVPGIAWWPGEIEAGRVTGDIASTMDIYTTCLKLGGANLPDDRIVDGLDLRDFLFLGTPSPRNSFYYYRGDELYAVRKGPFKAHFKSWYGYTKQPAESHDPPLLYDLDQDPGENYNVADQYPEILDELINAADQHLKTVVPGKPQFYKLSDVWKQQAQ